MTAIGSLHNLVTLGELQELRVQTSTFAPEFGRSPGAHVAVSTRSGSNDLHGEILASFRNSAMTANDWFAKRAGFDKAAHHLIDVGAVLGGPIRRDRTFGFVSFERVQLRQPITFTTVVPGAASRVGWLSAYPMPNGPEVAGGLARSLHRLPHRGRLQREAVESTMRSEARDRSLHDTVGLRRVAKPGFSTQPYKLHFPDVYGGHHYSRSGGAVTNDARVSVSRTTVEADWRPALPLLSSGVDRWPPPKSASTDSLFPDCLLW